MTQVNEAKNSKKMRRSRASQKTKGQIADFMGADAALLQRAIAAVTFAGGAIRFGYTRDGGAYAIGVYYDGDVDKDFVPGTEDFNDYLTTIIEDFAKE